MRIWSISAAVFALALCLGGGAAQAQLGTITEMLTIEPSAEFIRRDGLPSLATDGNGTWVVVWVSSNSVGGTSSFRNILSARSTDDGLTWSMPVRASGDVDDLGIDYSPSLATDGNGQWIVVWQVSNTIYPEPIEPDIYFAHSLDNGATWSTPGFINTDAAGDDRSDRSPRIATDRDETWIVTWHASGAGPSEIYCSRSIGGVVWSAPQLLSGTDDGYFPDIATDGVDWMILWTVSGSLGSGPDSDVVAVASTDGGQSWGPRTLVNTNALVDAEDDSLSCVASDGRGNWVVGLDSEGAPGSLNGIDRDVMVARSGDLGSTWSDSEPFNSDAAIDSSTDYRCSLVADSRGNWRAVWIKDDRVRTAMFRLPFADSCPTDLDGDGYGAPGDSACPLGALADCDDSNLWVGPQVPEVCDGMNNDCGDPLWPGLSGVESDDDGDGLTECAGDCRDDDGLVATERPGEVSLMLGSGGGQTLLEWSIASPPGGSAEALVYDVLRNDRVPFCLDGNLCLKTNQSGLAASDDEVPPQGEVLFYVVRAENSCGSGSIGTSTEDVSVATPRSAVDCP